MVVEEDFLLPQAGKLGSYADMHNLLSRKAGAGWKRGARARQLARTPYFLSAFSAVAYAAVAIAMNFVNKATLIEFPLSNVILVAQMLTGVVLIYPLRAAGVLSFPAITLAKCRLLLPVTALYTANTAAALAGLSNLNIPVYSALKRLTPMIVVCAKVYINQRLPSAQILASVALVLAGCLITGAGDLAFDAAGYAFAFASCSLQASYLIMVEQTGAEKGVGTAELLFYNSVLSTPFLLVLVGLTGEASKAFGDLRAAAQQNASFPVLFLVCCSLGCLLNYLLFLCTMNNSALTTAVVASLKGVVVTVLGFFYLGGARFSATNVAGICINTVGGVLYTAERYRIKVKAEAEGTRGGAANGHKHGEDRGREHGGAPEIPR